VQHHHAHIVSCLVENKVEGPVIGVAFDGTGYGTDGTVWGGEFMVADWHCFQRKGHLEYVPMPGGAAAIKKPYRMTLSYLYTLLGEDVSLEGLPLSHTRPAELLIIQQQLKRNVNSPLTSSAGRLFDAVSALVGVREEIDYEAQAAIELEMLAREDKPDRESYPLSIIEREGTRVVKLGKLFSAIMRDVRNHTPVPLISLRFHSAVAEMIAATCRLISTETGINDVALTGGVFQNRLLFRLTISALRRDGFSVITHHLVPCNDGGISLGQAVIANFSR
jgi:hydrogenase maturation protein HypF